MPIYEYKCTACGAHLEKLQKASDDPLTECGECGGKLEKQWSLSGFQFKGEGWYVTDYAGKKASDGDSKKSEGDSTDSGDSASKKTPEKKAEPKKEKSPASD
ncbi:MAG: zinc ribbon domain-containing protein [Pyrinomonadaceae bacterium]|nr:zinc ribbon domain-containing protein [Pyrinomonadaceae bacterium]